MSDVHLWVRAETRPTEQRAPIVPADAERLVADGVRVTVEESRTRVFPVADYRAVGCSIAEAGSWAWAPENAYIVGIKELPEKPGHLRHTHIYFAHAFKGQAGAAELLRRFAAGGGELLDVEYLTLDGRRVVAFGYWAGYVGAALGVLEARGTLPVPVAPMSHEHLEELLRQGTGPARALVIGALGRSGRGACAALEAAGVQVTRWDRNETRTLDRGQVLAHDLLVNCVVSHEPAPAFVRPEDLSAPERRLSVISDVTCDVTSEHNLIPVNTAVTTWDEPVRTVGTGDGRARVIAIDNLPSLLPREASIDFSAQLAPLVADLPERRGAWAPALTTFRSALAAIDAAGRTS